MPLEKPRYIVISETENHPLPAGLLQDAPEGTEEAVYVYGLKRMRGDDLVASTRLHDNLWGVLHKYGLDIYAAPMDNIQRERQSLGDKYGHNVHFLGIAYNIRKAYSPEKYAALVRDLADAIG